jgi:hypothetical protein
LYAGSGTSLFVKNLGPVTVYLGMGPDGYTGPTEGGLAGDTYPLDPGETLPLNDTSGIVLYGITLDPTASAWVAVASSGS